MAVGDMIYKFTDLDGVPQELVVPATVLRSGKKRGLSNRETIMEYAFNEGFAVTQPEASPKKTKSTSRKRQPNEKKRLLIERLVQSVSDLGEINVINPERQVQVSLDGQMFEFTLVQKRAPK